MNKAYMTYLVHIIFIFAVIIEQYKHFVRVRKISHEENIIWIIIVNILLLYS